MGGQRFAAGMGFAFITFGFDLRLDGRGFGLLLRGRFGEDGFQFGFVEPGFQREQFELVGIEIADAVGLRCKAGKGVEPPLLFQYDDALFLVTDVFLLLADVPGELRDDGIDPRAHRLRKLFHQRLDFTG